MLKSELLNTFTVEQWAKFKRYIKDKAIPVILDSDGYGHPDFPKTLIEEFLRSEDDKSKDGSGVQSVQPVDPTPIRSTT